MILMDAVSILNSGINKKNTKSGISVILLNESTECTKQKQLFGQFNNNNNRIRYTTYHIMTLSMTYSKHSNRIK